MTALGLVEGVERALYRDEVEQVNIYPLDQKLELLEIGGRYSRYSSNFARLVGDYYARLPERDVMALPRKTLNIELELGSMTAIGEAVAKPYLPRRYDEIEDERAPQDGVAREPGFLERRVQKIDVSPEREIILKSASRGKVDGVERKRAADDQTAIYILSDGTGVSGLPGELSDKGKNGGPAKTFEAKIGAVFTQNFNSDGLPLLSNGRIYRAPNSTRYTGAVEKIGQFTTQMDEFARKNDVEHAGQVIFLSDGAIWLENLRAKLFPNSIGVVDFYHASQRLYKIADSLRFYSKKKKDAFVAKCYSFLELGEIDQMADLITRKTIDSNRESVEKQLRYFTGNKDKTRYGLFRAAGLFIGSGVIEAGCKTIVENRLNRSGMRWTKKNAANVIALRCAIYSGTYDADAA